MRVLLPQRFMTNPVRVPLPKATERRKDVFDVTDPTAIIDFPNQAKRALESWSEARN